MFYLRRAYVLVAALGIVAVLSQSGVVPQNMEAASQVSLNDRDPVLWDAQGYASSTGVSVDEALRRFQLQDIARHLESELSGKEAETFAGLWVEHTPEFRVVVQFTQNGVETIRPYLSEELANIVEVRTAKVSLVDLQNARDQAIFNQGFGHTCGLRH